MIIVTGTKRSGTSMWMQILAAAGFPTIGVAFPRDWGHTIREANREGFFESPLRDGIYHATNPNPRTGEYLSPQGTRRSVVKVFVPGLVKSDLAYVDKVVATMRSVHEYAPSITRLYTMEKANKEAAALAQAREPLPPLDHLPPWLEWWNDNYRLLCDALLRGYPLHMVSYGAVLAEPERVVSETVGWLGGTAVEAAVARVRDALRTQHAELSEPVEPPVSAQTAEVFDELYARVHEQRPLDAAFIAALNATQERLEPEIREAHARARASRKRLRALRAKHLNRANP